MTDDDADNPVSIWPVTSLGKVGIEFAGTRKLLRPAEARTLADNIEVDARMFDDDAAAKLAEFADDLRGVADDVEGSA